MRIEDRVLTYGSTLDTASLYSSAHMRQNTDALARARVSCGDRTSRLGVLTARGMRRVVDSTARPSRPLTRPRADVKESEHVTTDRTNTRNDVERD
jgi:hypothetical protein